MDPKTIPDLVRLARETHRKPNAFLVRHAASWVPYPIDRFVGEVNAVGAWLRSQGIRAGDRVAILSESRYEWAVVDVAIMSMGAISVPFYPVLPAGQIAPLVADSGAVAAFVSTEAQEEKMRLVQAENAAHPSTARPLRFVWNFDASGLPGGADAGPEREPSPDDIATIIYTSGTTGVPKGVMLTHSNIASEVTIALTTWKLSRDDVYLSFLPLSHVLERCSGFYTMLYAGVTIAYAESFDKLPRDLREVCPTVIIGVPRLYEKVIARAIETAAGAGGITKNIFQNAYRVAIEVGRLKNEGKSIPPLLALQRAVGAALVYRKIARGLGGKTRLRVSGGAPLNAEAAFFYHGAGLPVHEGYGLTETSSAISVNTFERHRAGTVGPVFPGIDVRVAEDGELLVRGPVVMKGYWQKPKETEEALQDGWFHTGDIGEVDADGFLRITDRKKDLLVTSVGKKVAPQPIEAALKASPRILEALVLGEGQKFVAAMIVPAPGATREAIAEDVDRVNGTLAQFERIKRFELIPDDMTVEKGLMTPSLKLKRKAVMEHHREIVERLFRGA